MKVYANIEGFTKVLDMPFKPTPGENIYFTYDFREEFLREIAIQILNNYDIYKERGEKLLYEDMHDTWADDFWSDSLSLKISGYDQIESAFWDMDEKSQEMRYNIVLTESKPRDKVCCCSEEKYIELLKSAAVRL